MNFISGVNKSFVKSLIGAKKNIAQYTKQNAGSPGTGTVQQIEDVGLVEENNRKETRYGKRSRLWRHCKRQWGRYLIAWIVLSAIGLPITLGLLYFLRLFNLMVYRERETTLTV